MNLRRLAFLLPLLFAVPLASTARAEEKAKPKKELIVGTWNVTQSEDGVPEGTTVEFTKDGKLVLKIKDLTLEGKYEVTGDDLKVTIKTPDNKETTETNKIEKLTDTELTLKDPKGKVAKLMKKK